MSAMTPLANDAALVITPNDADGLMVSLYQNGEEGDIIASSAYGADENQFRWLVSSAATFHRIKVIDETSDDPIDPFAGDEDPPAAYVEEVKDV